jgi:hypothetical protein
MGRFVVMLQLSILIIISLFVCLFSVWMKPKETFKVMRGLIGEFFYCLNIFVNKSKEQEFEAIDIKKHLSEAWSAFNVDWSTLFQWLGACIVLLFVIWGFQTFYHTVTASSREESSIKYIIITNEDVINGDNPILLDDLIYEPKISYDSDSNIFSITYKSIDEDYCEDLFDSFVIEENPNYSEYYNPVWSTIIINNIDFVNRKQKNKDLACKEENSFILSLNIEKSGKIINEYKAEKNIFDGRAEKLDILIKENTYLRNSFDNFVKSSSIVPTKNNPFNRTILKDKENLKFTYPEWNKQECVSIIKDQIGLLSISDNRYGSHIKKWSTISLNNESIIEMRLDSNYNFREYIMEDLCLDSNIVSFLLYVEEVIPEPKKENIKLKTVDEVISDVINKGNSIDGVDVFVEEDATESVIDNIEEDKVE